MTEQPTDPPTDPRDFGAFVKQLAQDRHVVATLVARHRGDDRGDCRVCHVAWPCALAVLAGRAARLNGKG